MYINGEFDFQSAIKYPLNSFVLNNWTYNNKFKQIKGLYLNIWIKNNFEVFTLDESQYSNVGDHIISIVANDKVSLLEFVKDFNITDFTIEENDVIQQWG